MPNTNVLKKGVSVKVFSRSLMRKVFGLGPSDLEFDIKLLDKDQKKIVEKFRSYVAHCSKKRDLVLDWENEWNKVKISELKKEIDKVKSIIGKDEREAELFVRAVVHVFRTAAHPDVAVIFTQNDITSAMKQFEEDPNTQSRFLGVNEAIKNLARLFKGVSDEIKEQEKFFKDYPSLGKEVKDHKLLINSIDREQQLLTDMVPYIEILHTKIHESVRLFDESITREKEFFKGLKGVHRYDGIKLFTGYIPLGGLGGDIVLDREIAPDFVEVLIGDFSNKGIAAAKYKLDFYDLYKKVVDTKPIKVTERSLRLRLAKLIRSFRKINLPDTVFMSAMWLWFDLKNKLLYHYDAGFGQGFLIKKGKQCIIEDLRDVIGTRDFRKRIPPFNNYTLGTHKKKIVKNPLKPVDISDYDRVVLFTDGITEERNMDNKAFGVDGALALLKHIESKGKKRVGCEKYVSSILSFVGAFRGKGAQQDDITLVVIDL